MNLQDVISLRMKPVHHSDVKSSASLRQNFMHRLTAKYKVFT